jgi:hypothetical protein
MLNERVCCNEAGNCHLVCMNSFQTGAVKATVEIVCCITVRKAIDLASQFPKSGEFPTYQMCNKRSSPLTYLHGVDSENSVFFMIYVGTWVYVWPYVNMYGLMRTCVALCEHVWPYVNMCGLMWTNLYYGTLWLTVEVPGNLQWKCAVPRFRNISPEV